MSGGIACVERVSGKLSGGSDTVGAMCAREIFYSERGDDFYALCIVEGRGVVKAQ